MSYLAQSWTAKDSIIDLSFKGSKDLTNAQRGSLTSVYWGSLGLTDSLKFLKIKRSY